MTHKDKIIQFSENIGFDKIGFAKAEELSREFSAYTEWLKKKYNAGMHYLEKYLSKRQDIRLLLDGAETVIIVAKSYNSAIEHDYIQGKNGKVARYAWGKDYHFVLKEKLKKLSDFISELDNYAKSVYFVDSGPVMEKQWAVKAGIGWQGKNSVIINDELGSFIFLGTLITTLEAEPDKSAEDLCGKCNICVESCPTGAINDNRSINAEKCISYWTIETKSGQNIPDFVKKSMTGWVFGCDICQELCPKNKNAALTKSEEFLPIEGITCLDKNEILQMSNGEFKRKFKGSPIVRTGLKGIVRNFNALEEK